MYDGNLLTDFDRKICTIQYNILNLPEIIQFCNGNSIVNAYNAEGVKLSSTYYTLPEAIAVPAGEVLEPDSVLNAPRTMTVQYLGHMDKTIIGDSVSYVMHHSEGYVSMDRLYRIISWNYFRRDHLGNNVAVWNATADTTVQRMFYYPSGLPMALSSGQGAQPYKYNGKEYNEMHGYDVYDYGFRGYYATIARFTSIDPLCEKTPWQSPYCYASNNFTGEIDWMGLFSGGGFTGEGHGICHYIVVNQEGLVIGYDLDSPDHHVYMVDPEEWDGKYESLNSSQIIGWEIPGWKEYRIGQPCYYLGSVTQSYVGNGTMHIIGGTALMYGRHSVTCSIDNTSSALWHYWFGFGARIALGDNFTRKYLMAHPSFQKERQKILAGTIEDPEKFSIDMEQYVFHIGDTDIYYYTQSSFTVFSIGIGDAFCDAIYVFEKGASKIGFIEADGMGGKLELGWPYKYIPTAVLIPNNY